MNLAEVVLENIDIVFDYTGYLITYDGNYLEVVTDATYIGDMIIPSHGNMMFSLKIRLEPRDAAYMWEIFNYLVSEISKDTGGVSSEQVRMLQELMLNDTICCTFLTEIPFKLCEYKKVRLRLCLVRLSSNKHLIHVIAKS